MLVDLAHRRAATNLQFVKKNIISAKHDGKSTVKRGVPAYSVRWNDMPSEAPRRTSSFGRVTDQLSNK